MALPAPSLAKSDDLDGGASKLVEVNERLCDLRPVRVVGDGRERAQLEKKLRRRFSGK